MRRGRRVASGRSNSGRGKRRTSAPHALKTLPVLLLIFVINAVWILHGRAAVLAAAAAATRTTTTATTTTPMTTPTSRRRSRSTTAPSSGLAFQLLPSSSPSSTANMVVAARKFRALSIVARNNYSNPAGSTFHRGSRRSSVSSLLLKYPSSSWKASSSSVSLLASPTDHGNIFLLSLSLQSDWTAIVSESNTNNDSLLSLPVTIALQLCSAFLTYVGFTLYYDRPRGTLRVDENTDVEVKRSSVDGAGLGLFARTNLSKDRVLGTYPGVVVPIRRNLDKLKQYPQCEGYVWRFSDNGMVIDPTDSVGDLKDVCVGGTGTGTLSSHWMFRTIAPVLLSIFTERSVVKTTLCRINEPPRGMDVNVVTDENVEQRTVTFVLERDVYAGEELFIDYGLYYDRSMYPRGGVCVKNDLNKN